MRRKPHFVRITIAVCSVIFMCWQFTETRPFMPEHFLVSFEALNEGRFWTLFTSMYSHNMLLHFFINMYVLWSFGSFLETFLGHFRFAAFYILAGLMGSLSHALTSMYFMGDPQLPALGASGAIAGIILVFSLCFPREKILLLGILPLPAIVGAFLFIGLDLWGLYEQSQGHGLPIGHGAHLGGAFTGLFIFLFYIRPRILKARKIRQTHQPL